MLSISRRRIIQSTFVVEFLAKLVLMVSFIRTVAHLEIFQFIVVISMVGVLLFILILVREYNFEMLRIEESNNEINI